MSLADTLDVEVDLDLDEDETVLDRIFLEVDVWRTIIFSFVVMIATCAMVSMSILLYVFERELARSGGYLAVYYFGQTGILAAFGCLFFAVCAMIYRSQNGYALDCDVDEEGS